VLLQDVDLSRFLRGRDLRWPSTVSLAAGFRLLERQ
jgi:hypothetical protein